VLAVTKAACSDYYIELDETYGAHNYKPLDVVISRAEGCRVWDPEGREYYDFLSAYSAVNQGHCHPVIIESARNQLEKVTLTSRAFRNDRMGPFLKRLCELTGYDMALPMNSGAEGVCTALKLARKWGYQVKGIPDNQAEIVVCAGNFHGRTITIVGFSSEEQYRADFGPFTPGFTTVPYGDIEALNNALNERTCAFLVEPIQGEGGIIIPPLGYLTAARKLCRERNVLFVLDEIQTGLGRTGRMFCHEHEEDAKPDVLILGKALGGGVVPVSAVLANRNVMGLIKPGDHGSTFGGNPFASEVALTALEVIVEENLPQRAMELGTYLVEQLKTIRSEAVVEIRGRGLLVGIELNQPARKLCEALLRRGVLAKETHDMVLRLAPPLTISRQELDEVIERIREALTQDL